MATLPALVRAYQPMWLLLLVTLVGCVVPRCHDAVKSAMKQQAKHTMNGSDDYALHASAATNACFWHHGSEEASQVAWKVANLDGHGSASEA